ncbi:MAG: hypothetical protein H6733_04135 [Alphaproteobacteria bacterium]|nr:hypothetical protein [Alphaproteobacteria bacterium]
MQSALLPSCILMFLLPVAAHAEIGVGTWGLVDYATSDDLGSLLVTDGSPPNGFDAYTDVWTWDGTAWPDTDFYLASQSITVGTSPAIYDAEDFPSEATSQLPSSLGTNEALYRIAECDLGTASCAPVGFLWVQLDDDTLHWFMDAGYSGDRFEPTGGDVLAFLTLASVPGTSASFRYLKQEL